MWNPAMLVFLYDMAVDGVLGPEGISGDLDACP